MSQVFCISRTDSIGDVILTLPMATVLKEKFPKSKIFFLGRTYTIPIINKQPAVDEVLNWDEIELMESDEQVQYLKNKKIDTFIHVFPDKKIAKLVKRAEIPTRIGTSHRLFHFLTCNKKVSFSRKNSDLHESQLNLKLLGPIIGKKDFSISEIADRTKLKKPSFLEERFVRLIDKDKFNLILHPRSQGSAVEWGLQNYTALLGLLPQDKFKIFVSGTEKEKASMKKFLMQNEPFIQDVTGLFSLDEFISFIDACDGLVACSTGPLHIASALNKYALGIYSEKRPIHSARWGPIGVNSEIIINTSIEVTKDTDPFEEIQGITPERVSKRLLKWVAKSTNQK